MDKVKLMTYREISDLLRIKIESAKALRRRKNWTLSKSNSGRENLVAVPLDFIDRIGSIDHEDSPVTGDMTGDVTSDLIEKITQAHQTIGELQFKLKAAELKNKEFDEIQRENNKLVVNNQIGEMKISNLQDTLNDKKAELEGLKNEYIEYRKMSFWRRWFYK